MGWPARDTAIAREFSDSLKGWGWSREREDACREAVFELGRLHPAFGSTPWTFGSGCLVLVRMGMSDESVEFCHKIGGTAHYGGVAMALAEAGDVASLEKLARKGSREERQRALDAVQKMRSGSG